MSEWWERAHQDGSYAAWGREVARRQWWINLSWHERLSRRLLPTAVYALGTLLIVAWLEGRLHG